MLKEKKIISLWFLFLKKIKLMLKSKSLEWKRKKKFNKEMDIQWQNHKSFINAENKDVGLENK